MFNGYTDDKGIIQTGAFKGWLMLDKHQENKLGKSVYQVCHPSGAIDAMCFDVEITYPPVNEPKARFKAFVEFCVNVAAVSEVCHLMTDMVKQKSDALIKHIESAKNVNELSLKERLSNANKISWAKNDNIDSKDIPFYCLTYDFLQDWQEEISDKFFGELEALQGKYNTPEGIVALRRYGVDVASEYQKVISTNLSTEKSKPIADEISKFDTKMKENELLVSGVISKSGDGK